MVENVLILLVRYRIVLTTLPLHLHYGPYVTRSPEPTQAPQFSLAGFLLYAQIFTLSSVERSPLYLQGSPSTKSCRLPGASGILPPASRQPRTPSASIRNARRPTSCWRRRRPWTLRRRRSSSRRHSGLRRPTTAAHSSSSTRTRYCYLKHGFWNIFNVCVIHVAT
jgi:hypothetical protein